MVSKDSIIVKGRIEQGYEWTAGLALSRFLQELRDNGRIVGTRCNKCNQMMVPPRIFCEKCFIKAEDWEVASDAGTVNCFTVSNIGIDASRLPEPVILALIDLDGGGALFHYLSEIDPNEVQIGMKVKAVFKHKSERTGSILDLKYFKPI